MFYLALPLWLALSLARFPPRSAVLSRPRTLVWCLFSPVWECVCLRVISLYRSPSLPQSLALSPARALPFSLWLPQFPLLARCLSSPRITITALRNADGTMQVEQDTDNVDAPVHSGWMYQKHDLLIMSYSSKVHLCACMCVCVMCACVRVCVYVYVNTTHGYR